MKYTFMKKKWSRRRYKYANDHLKSVKIEMKYTFMNSNKNKVN